MTSISNPHDKLFKQIWSDRETAPDFLANYLPQDISSLMDLKTLEICKDSFVDKHLKEHFSDLLYMVLLFQNTFLPPDMKKNCLKYLGY
jgi:predicted transposase/invertase (TIGR01784 family)